MRKRGRCGDVEAAVDGRVLRFDWEFGGGNCIAIVAAPDPDDWLTRDPHRHFEREGFLAWLAGQVASRECPAARIEIGRTGILFLEPASTA